MLLVPLTAVLRGAVAVDGIYVLISCRAGWDGSCSTSGSPVPRKASDSEGNGAGGTEQLWLAPAPRKIWLEPNEHR